MVVRANRKGGIYADHCDALIEINIARMIYYFDLGGAYFIGFVGFLLSIVATMAFLLGVEIFAAIFMLAFPITIVSAFSIRFAYKAQRLGWSGENLRHKLKWRRFWNQVIGMIATIAAVGMAIYYYFQATNAYWPTI